MERKSFSQRGITVPVILGMGFLRPSLIIKTAKHIQVVYMERCLPDLNFMDALMPKRRQKARDNLWDFRWISCLCARGERHSYLQAEAVVTITSAVLHPEPAQVKLPDTRHQR